MGINMKWKEILISIVMEAIPWIIAMTVLISLFGGIYLYKILFTGE